MRNAENCRLNGTKLSADFNFDYYGEFYMKIDNKKARIILAVIIAVSLVISTVYMFAKQGFHEDELLTYNLANSSKQLMLTEVGTVPKISTSILPCRPMTDSTMLRYMKIRL